MTVNTNKIRPRLCRAFPRAPNICTQVLTALKLRFSYQTCICIV